MSGVMSLRRAIILSIALVLLAQGMAIAEDVLPIKDILASPTDFHRRKVLLSGMVKDISSVEGKDTLNLAMCGQGFFLDDETGSIEVIYLVKCVGGAETVEYVHAGEHIVVEATIDAPPSNVKHPSGSSFDFRAMATKITRPKK